MATQHYIVTGMTCGHCEAAVKEEVSGIDGVTAVDVSLNDGALAVTAEREVDDAAVFAAVEEAGYSAAKA
ncbi:heavy metal transporter [Corynebacterium atypicum]|uniref:Heavy metal transporter n=1 Tax=Corynebacterium atypicum TaxID=191610 RepID=A0ABM5QND3_9CORY|nr:cation transporter [Corynebacterium atypicum]AIG64276.1 heavy metal transporter [Corynebacterium atypicum]